MPGVRAIKIVRQKVASENRLKIKRKMVTKRVAVRAVNIPMIRIDAEFRDAAIRDDPGVQGCRFGEKLAADEKYANKN